MRVVLVHRPGEELLTISRDAPELHLFRERPRLDAAVREFDELVDALKSLGVEVVNVNRWRDANQVFVRDAAVVTKAGAILANFGARVRQGEEEVVAGELKRLGVPVVSRVKSPGHFEFGDLLFLRPDAVLLGLSRRSDGCGARQVAALLRRFGAVRRCYVTEVLPPAVHLDMAVNLASEQLAALYPGAVDGAAEEALRAEGYEVVQVPEGDFRNLALNWLAVEPGRVLMVDGYGKNRYTRRLLESFGVDVVSVDISELAKGQGGVRCMTLPVLREER